MQEAVDQPRETGIENLKREVAGKMRIKSEETAEEDESLLKRTRGQGGFFFREAYPRWVSLHVMIAVHSSPKPVQVVGRHRTRGRQCQLECIWSVSTWLQFAEHVLLTSF